MQTLQSSSETSNDFHLSPREIYPSSPPSPYNQTPKDICLGPILSALPGVTAERASRDFSPSTTTLNCAVNLADVNITMQLLPDDLQEEGHHSSDGADRLSAASIKSRLDAVCSPSCNRVVKSRQNPTSGEEYVQLNKYRLMAEIGQGSYGIVKLAYNEQDKNLYAMKVLDKKKLMKKFAYFRKPPPRAGKSPQSVPDPLQRVQQEIAILKKLKHPNVVKLIEVLDDPLDDYLYMVFEYVERGCVLEIPTTEPLKEPVAWNYFRDTVMGLEYLHFQKIIHRDIKPSNLLLSDSGRVKIADFGVSSVFEGLDALLSGTAGTPAFLAPETLVEESKKAYSGKAQDIWSLGITLYSFLYGQVPFWDSYVIALHMKIRQDPIVFPQLPFVSDACKDLMLKLLEKNPQNRHTLVDVKKDPWVTASGTKPLPSEAENCSLVTVTEEEVLNSVKVMPKLGTLILIKTMVHRKHFGNPFRRKGITRTGSALPLLESGQQSSSGQAIKVSDRS